MLIIILGVNIMILPESLPLGSKYVRLTLCLLLFRSKLFGNRCLLMDLKSAMLNFYLYPRVYSFHLFAEQLQAE